MWPIVELRRIEKKKKLEINAFADPKGPFKIVLVSEKIEKGIKIKKYEEI